MNKVRILLKVASTRDAEEFYCKDLELFDFHQDYGMGTIALVLKTNPNFFLILSTGNREFNEEYLFEYRNKRLRCTTQPFTPETLCNIRATHQPRSF